MRPSYGMVTQIMGDDGSGHTGVLGMMTAIQVDSETLAEPAWQASRQARHKP